MIGLLRGEYLDWVVSFALAALLFAGTAILVVIAVMWPPFSVILFGLGLLVIATIAIHVLRGKFDNE